MEIILFGNSLSLVNLAIMAFLYIFTISMTLCGTITIEDIKSILSLTFLKDIKKIKEEKEEKEGFINIRGNKLFGKNIKTCNKFSQNKCIDDDITHPLHSSNMYELEPEAYENEPTGVSQIH